ncbi:MAG: hypothetical protein ABEJ89_04400 [Haloarculaceae archaeon]
MPDYPEPPTEPDSVQPAALSRRINGGEPVRLLDVRDRDEIEAWAIDGPSVTTTTIPFQRFLQAGVTDGVDDLAADVAGEGPITVGEQRLHRGHRRRGQHCRERRGAVRTWVDVGDDHLYHPLERGDPRHHPDRHADRQERLQRDGVGFGGADHPGRHARR